MEKYELMLALGRLPGRYAKREDPRLVPGDHVKLCFRAGQSTRQWIGIQGERLPVEVTAVEGTWPDAAYRGEVCEEPCWINRDYLDVGQPVEFSGEHIYEVIHDSAERGAA